MGTFGREPCAWIRDWRLLAPEESALAEQLQDPRLALPRLRRHRRKRIVRALQAPSMVLTFGLCFVIVGVAVSGVVSPVPGGETADLYTGIPLASVGALATVLAVAWARWRLRRDPLRSFLRDPSGFRIAPARYGGSEVHVGQVENHGKPSRWVIELTWAYEDEAGLPRRMREHVTVELRAGKRGLSRHPGRAGWVAHRTGGEPGGGAGSDAAFLFAVAPEWLEAYGSRSRVERRAELVLALAIFMVSAFAFFWVLGPLLIPSPSGAT